MDTQIPWPRDASDHDDGNNDECFPCPPGYRFCPTDEELIIHYLRKKINGEALPILNRIINVRLYDFNPDELAARHKYRREKICYFFTPRDRKYPKGKRPNRAAGDGYWKACAADKEIKSKGEIIGYRKALVYHTGKSPHGIKTNWMMHEFTLNQQSRPPQIPQIMTMDGLVLCKIYKTNERDQLPILQQPSDGAQPLSQSTPSPVGIEPSQFNDLWQPQSSVGPQLDFSAPHASSLQSLPPNYFSSQPSSDSLAPLPPSFQPSVSFDDTSPPNFFSSQPSSDCLAPLPQSLQPSVSTDETSLLQYVLPSVLYSDDAQSQPSPPFLAADQLLSPWPSASYQPVPLLSDGIQSSWWPLDSNQSLPPPSTGFQPAASPSATCQPLWLPTYTGYQPTASPLTSCQPLLQTPSTDVQPFWPPPSASCQPSASSSSSCLQPSQSPSANGLPSPPPSPGVPLSPSSSFWLNDPLVNNNDFMMRDSSWD